MWDHLCPPPARLSGLPGPSVGSSGTRCCLPASCQLWLLGRTTRLTLLQMMARHGPLGGPVLTGGRLLTSESCSAGRPGWGAGECDPWSAHSSFTNVLQALSCSLFFSLKTHSALPHGQPSRAEGRGPAPSVGRTTASGRPPTSLLGPRTLFSLFLPLQRPWGHRPGVSK